MDTKSLDSALVVGISFSATAMVPTTLQSYFNLNEVFKTRFISRVHHLQARLRIL